MLSDEFYTVLRVCVHLSKFDGRCQTESLSFRLRTSDPSLTLTQSQPGCFGAVLSTASRFERSQELAKQSVRTAQYRLSGRAVPRRWRSFILLQRHTVHTNSHTSLSNSFLETSLVLPYLFIGFGFNF